MSPNYFGTKYSGVFRGGHWAMPPDKIFGRIFFAPLHVGDIFVTQPAMSRF